MSSVLSSHMSKRTFTFDNISIKDLLNRYYLKRHGVVTRQTYMLFCHIAACFNSSRKSRIRTDTTVAPNYVLCPIKLPLENIVGQ